MKPQIGPATPMSSRAFLPGMNDCVLISAPSVPIAVGAGMKYGSVARTPWYAAMKKCPNSCTMRMASKLAEKGIPAARRPGCATMSTPAFAALTRSVE